jgi:hypothetical protein
MAIKELTFEEQYEDVCPNCGEELYSWEWYDDKLEFMNNCSCCGTELILRPTQAILEVIVEPDIDGEEEQDYDE